MKRIAFILCLLPSVVLATTAPVTVSNTPPSLGGPCQTVAAPANMFMVNMTSGEMLRCNGTPPAAGVWVAWGGGGPASAVTAPFTVGATSVTATGTEINYLIGVTSAIQTQFTNKQPLDADLASIAALGTTGFPARTTTDTYAARSIAVGSTKISITNPAGVAGNPTLDAVEANFALQNIGGTATDAQVSDTLTASLFVGSGSTTTAIDAATAEFAGTIAAARMPALTGEVTTTVNTVASVVTDDMHLHNKQYYPLDWNVLTRSNYDANGDATNDAITWPGYTGTSAPGRQTILNVGTNTSGIAWSEKYQVWIIVTNGLEDLDGDAGTDDQMWMGDVNGTRIWAGPLPGGTRDWESVTLTNPYSDYVYVLAEQASQDIVEFDIRELFRIALGATPTAVGTWDIDAVDTTACVNGSNGYEGMTFVPDKTQCTSYVTTDMPCGYFLLECQANNGTFYKFRLDTAGVAVSLLDNSAAAPCGANDTTGDGDALDTDWSTGLIYQSIGGGQDILLVFDAAFGCFARMALPNGGATDYEGFAIGPNGIIGTCDDAGGDCHTYQWPRTEPKPINTTPLILDANIGVVIYSNATAATHDTGALTCGRLGRRCVTTYLPVGTNAACSNDYNTGAGTPFFAVCR